MHPSGHEIKIAHKGLSPEVMENLEAIPMHLAKGGRAKYAQRFDPNMKGSKPSKSTNTMPGSPTEAKDNFTEPDAMGTDIPKDNLKQEMNDKHYPDVVVGALSKEAPPFGPLGAPKFHEPPCINPSCKSFGKSHPNCRCYGGKMQGTFGAKMQLAEGGKVESYCSQDRPHQEGCEYFKAGGVAESGEDEELKKEIAQETSPQDPTAQQYGQEVIPPPAPGLEQVAQPQQPMAQENVNPNPEVNRAPAEAPVQTESSKAPEAPIQTFEQHKQAATQELFPEAQAFKADLDNGHIQPQTYSDLFAKKDTLGKIGTLFGLLVGGAGSGLTGQPNAILEMMNKEIERDLDAQKQSVVNKQNYLKINQQHVDTRLKAFALSKAQMNYAALHKLVNEVTKLPNGPQKDQAMATLAMLNQSVDAENFNILDKAATASALGKVMFGDQSGGQPNTGLMKSGLMGPEAREMGTDIEEKSIPGIPGRASKPIPQQKRDQLQAMQVLDQKIADTLEFARAHKGTLLPKDRKIGEQKAHELMNFYNSSIDNGVLTQGRMAWLDKQVGKNPTSIFQDILGNNAQLEEIQRSNNTRKNIMLKQLGFDVKPSKKSVVTPEQTSKSGKEIIFKDGKAYYK